MYIYVNAKGRERLAPSVIRNNSKFGTYNVVPKGFTIKPGYIKIGSGAEGDIYASYKNKTMTNIVVRKVGKKSSKPLQQREYELTRKIYKIVPKHVVNMRSLTNTNLLMNMYRGGAIGDWLKKNEVDDDVLRILILQVISTLFKIHRYDSSFRHNDLHLGNVFIDDRTDPETKFGRYTVPNLGVSIRLADFGFAFDKQYPPLTNHSGYGIYVGNDKLYDVHFFLNSLYERIVVKKSTKFPLTAKFLKDILKGGYAGIGSSKTYVLHYRLKKGVKFPHTFESILDHPYFAVAFKKSKTITKFNNVQKKIVNVRLANKNIKNWGGNYSPIKNKANYLLRPRSSPFTPITPYSPVSIGRLPNRKNLIKKFGVVKGKAEYSFRLKTIIRGMNSGKYKPMRNAYVSYYGPTGLDKYKAIMNKYKNRKTKKRPSPAKNSLTYKVSPVQVIPIKKKKSKSRNKSSPNYMKYPHVSGPQKYFASFESPPKQKTKTPSPPKQKTKTPSPRETIFNFINKSNLKTLKPRNIYDKLVELKHDNPKQKTKNIVEAIVKVKSTSGEAWEKAKKALQNIAVVTRQ